MLKSLIPIEEIKNARSQNILFYCNREKIPLTRDAGGKVFLSDREHVEVTDNYWINHKNKTRGGAIDFVAYHRNVGFLQAVAAINDNPRLLALQKFEREVNKPYQAFYLPTGLEAPRENAVMELAKLLGHSPKHPVYGELMKRQMAQVSRRGSIFFKAGKESGGCVEYIPNAHGGYQSRKRGTIRTPFYSQHGRSKELILFVDPRTFLKRCPDFHRLGKDPAILALFEPNLMFVQQALTNARIKRVQLIHEPEDGERLKLFKADLEKAFNPFSIDISLAWEPAVELAQSRDLGRSREISFSGGIGG